jgi:hypothetical protein
VWERQRRAVEGGDTDTKTLRRLVVMRGTWKEWVSTTVTQLAAQQRLRSLRALSPRPDSCVHVNLGGKPLTTFSSNDYLGLSMHSQVRAAAAMAAATHGCGPRSSALVCGYTDEHRLLEQELAALKGTEEALLLPTGYAANPMARMQQFFPMPSIMLRSLMGPGLQHEEVLPCVSTVTMILLIWKSCFFRQRLPGS